MDTDDKKGWLKTRPGERCFIRVPANQTGGVYSAVEITSEPGDATPLHCHAHEDEHLMVLEGIAKVAVGGQVFCPGREKRSACRGISRTPGEIAPPNCFASSWLPCQEGWKRPCGSSLPAISGSFKWWLKGSESPILDRLRSRFGCFSREKHVCSFRKRGKIGFFR